ncbi:MAG TPA: hypothetical protein VFI10_05530 [Gaiellaceae bacterium]|jgi:hypothetical protein|nr:hypothetical protein [Gaiellaceae bacterium]
MSRRLGLGLAALAAVVLVPAALGAYPTPFAQQGGEGVASRDGALRFVAAKSGDDTVVRALRSDGSVAMSRPVAGSFGIPLLTYKGPGGGLFHDGSAFVLQSVGFGPETTFKIVDAGNLSTRDTIALEGTFAYDALSPDGGTLYLIQHTSSDDLQHYVVRAYDLREHALLPGKIADKTQRGWVMQGFPAARATTPSGRWVYTMYWNPNGFPFVHALDTVAGVAHCVGFAAPRPNSSTVLDYTLTVKGKKLLVRMRSGVLYRSIDRTTWRVTKPKA